MQEQNSKLQSRSLSLQELKQANKTDLQAIYKEVIGHDPDASLTRPQLIDAIADELPKDSGSAVGPVADVVKDVAGSFYGNKDTEKKFELPADWASKVVVHQCQIEQMNGGVVEVPNTHQLQTYDVATYEKLSRDEKDKPSFFSESKMKVVVLHDPRA